MNNPVIAELARHLPPSAATLRLADMNGEAGDSLKLLRPDVEAISVADTDGLRGLGESSMDAVMATGHPTADFLAAALQILRQGGRLILFEAGGAADEGRVKILENAGYTRILVETLTDDDGALLGVLMRGEKPHKQSDTLARVAVAAIDAPRADLASFRGRYVHVLVRQTPNKPAWALRPDEPVEWHVVALAGENGAALAFSSLPSAVGFMQRAVLANAIQGVSKVAKFSKEAAAAWAFTLIFNPLFDDVKAQGLAIVYAVDPQTAVHGEE
jgi:hypothetical protein